MQQILTWDISLLQLINSAHSPWMDAFMYTLSGSIVWLPVVATFLWWLFRSHPWQEGIILLACLGLCILISDQLASGIAKPLVARPRPTHTPGLSESLHIVYGYRGGIYGFFSSHAANYAAAGVLLSLIVRLRWHTLAWISLVTLVCYSRIYLGVHYPTDILAGLATGTLTGTAVYHWVYRPAVHRLSPQSNLRYDHPESAPLTRYKGALLSFVPIVAWLSWQTAEILARL